MFIGPSTVYALCEWLVLYRNKISIERSLGVANLACGGLIAFGVIANLYEALTSNNPPGDTFIIWFVLIGRSITIYLFASGWYRTRLSSIV